MTFVIVYIKFVFQGCVTTTYVYRTRGNGFTDCEIPYFSLSHRAKLLKPLQFSNTNKFLKTDFTIKINVKKQRRFDCSTDMFKLKDKIFFMHNQL